MVEWSITTVLKTVVPRGTGGSNPSLSATNAENQQIAKQTPSFTPKNVKSGVFVLFKIIQPLHNKRVAILKESDEKRLIFIYPFSLIFPDFTSSPKVFVIVFQRREWIIIQVFCVDRISFCLMYESTYL